jgi:MATE family multidrug resistance protein
VSAQLLSQRRIEATHRRFLTLALPMMLAHVTEPLLGLVDTAAIGRIGDVALLGAVAIGAILFDVLFWGFGALRMSTAGLTAQAHGAGDDREIGLAVLRALALAGGLGLLMIALQMPILAAAMALMAPSPEVETATRLYVSIRIWSAPAALANYAILGSLIGRGRTDFGLGLQIAINLTKIALTVLFVPLLEFGIAGTGAATLLAEFLGTAGGVAILRHLGFRLYGIGRADLLASAPLKHMLVVNRDIAIRTLALLAAFSFFTAQGSRAGDVTLAANAVLYNLFLFGSYFLDGFATAAEQMCGQALGSRDETGFRQAARLALGWSMGTGLVVSLLVFVGGAQFIGFVAANDAVRATAQLFLPFAALTPVVGAAAFAYDGIFIGATWTRAMRDLMLVALALYLGTFWLARGWSNAGLWTAFLLFLGVRGLGQAFLYPRLARASFAPR